MGSSFLRLLMPKSTARWGCLLCFLFLFSACAGGLTRNSARSSSRSSSNSLFTRSDSPSYPDQAVQEAPSTTGRMDGVEFVINEDLAKASPLSEASDFPELESAFETSDRIWRPRKGFSIPVVRNDRVDRWITYFTGPLRSHYTRWLRRSATYAPLIEKILREYHLPPDLIYLAMIESGFNLNAYSHANAAGPWQFIRSTGRMYGLESGGLVDERRNIIESTRAAAAHLRDLYRLYGNWYLAFAAYNSGTGTVNRAIARGGTKDFWKLSATGHRYFRQETKDYVPRILAAAIIAKDYRKYGFSTHLFGKPISFDEVTVPDATDVTVIAKCTGTTEDEIRTLNPALVAGVTPPGKRYTVNIPEGKAQRFKKNYAKVPRSQRVNYVFHQVKRRENLAVVARKYHTSPSQLAKINHMTPRSKLRPGMYVMIPKNKAPGPALDELFGPEDEQEDSQPATVVASTSPIIDVVAEAEVEGPSNDSLFEVSSPNADEVLQVAAEVPSVQTSGQLFYTHRVRKGETVGLIAKKYGVTVSSLKGWNGIGRKGLIKSGQNLKIMSTASPKEPASLQLADSLAGDPSKPRLIVHAVRRGDTLWKLAQRYGVTVAQIKEWNRLHSNALRPNQKIRIFASNSLPTNRRIALAQ